MIEDTHRHRAATENDPAYHATILDAARERARAKLSRRAAEQEEFRRREAADNLAALQHQQQVEQAAAEEQAFLQGVHDFHLETSKGLRVARATEQFMNTVQMIEQSERAELACALGGQHAAVHSFSPAVAHANAVAHADAVHRSISPPPPARGLFRPALGSPGTVLGSPGGNAELEALQHDMAAAHFRMTSAPPGPFPVPGPVHLMPPPAPLPAVILEPNAAQSFHLVRHGSAAKPRTQSDADGDTASPGGGAGRD